MASRVEAVCVDPRRVHEFWPHVAPLIRRAYERQPCLDTFELVESKVLSGVVLVWVAWDGLDVLAATITEIWKVPAGKVCALLATSGYDLKRWKHLLARIEQFARDEGCYLMYFEGRKGWQRILPDYSTRIILEKKL